MIRISGDLQPLINKVEKIPMEIESAVAEAMMASEGGIRDVLLSDYSGIFQDFVIEPGADLSISVVLNRGDIYHFHNATGADIDYLIEPIKNVVKENLNQSISKCMGVNFGS
jgi:hypothetical protein